MQQVDLSAVMVPVLADLRANAASASAPPGTATSDDRRRGQRHRYRAGPAAQAFKTFDQPAGQGHGIKSSTRLRIVNRYRGSIELADTPGDGTTIHAPAFQAQK